MRARERGLTIIELMVSLLMAMLVIAGGYAVMLTQQRIARAQTQVQVSQSGLWTSMELIQRDVRKAGMGFGFCRYQELNGFVNRSVFEAWRRVDGAARRFYALTVVDGGTTGTDELWVTYGAPRAGGVPDGRLTDTPAIWTQSSVTLFPNPAGYNQEEGFMYPAGCDCIGGTPTCAAPDGSAAKPYPLALLYNAASPPPSPPTVCSVVQVSGTSCLAASPPAVSPVLSTASGAAYPWNRGSGGTAGQAYTNTMQILNLGDVTRVRWYVQPTAVPNLCTQPPCLIRATLAADDTQTPQVVASGVEDLQVVPACDVNNDGVIGLEGANDTAKQSDEWFNNVAGESVTIASTGCLTYPQVRISIIARTGSEDQGFAPQTRPALENHAAATTADRYRRRILSAVVAPPNIGI